MKKLGALLAAALLLLHCGCAPAEPPAERDVPLQEGFVYSENALVRSEEARSLVIGAVSYDQKGDSLRTSLTVLVREGQGRIALMPIPRDTRVWVENYGREGDLRHNSYGKIGAVYHAAESAGLAEMKTMEAVSALLGGVRIDHYALLNTVQLESLAALTPGVYLTVEDAISDFGIQQGFQNISPRIAGYASYSYLNDIGGVDYSGTDIGKLERHQQLIMTLMKTLASQMSDLPAPERDALAQSIADCLRTDLTKEEIRAWLSGGALDFEEPVILPGTQTEGERESYWIADAAKSKEWVLRCFYPDKRKTS